jgi:hypothetical protein
MNKSRIGYIAVIFTTIILSMSLSSKAYADVNVDGYYKKNGTYVQPHQRSDPNNDRSDNWSSKGNTNPYTNKKGYKNDD